MPHKAPTPCNHRGCKAVVNGRYCPAHEREHMQTWRREHDQHRESPAQRGYDARWRRIRRIQLAHEPFCQARTHCPGAVATEVDHIDGDTRNNDATNLQSICRQCHNAKTNREQGGLGHPRRARAVGHRRIENDKTKPNRAKE